MNQEYTENYIINQEGTDKKETSYRQVETVSDISSLENVKGEEPGDPGPGELVFACNLHLLELPSGGQSTATLYSML